MLKSQSRMILYSQFLDDLTADLIRVADQLQHIDPARIISVGASRVARGKYGNLAECVALGMDESPTYEFSYHRKSLRMVGATPWFRPTNRRLLIDKRHMLYLLRFRFPRFLDHSPLDTLIHELLHVSEKFDGSHRALRHGVWFNRYVADIARQWRRKGDPSLAPIVDLDFEGLRRRFGAVACRCFRKPFRTPLRLPTDSANELQSHPQVKQMGLKIGPKPLRPIAMKFDDPADLELTEADLEYRVFYPGGSRRISPALVRSHPDWNGRG